MRNGLAYRSDDGSVYFAIERFPAYGKLATWIVTARAGARVAQDEYDKNDAGDFALWKAWTPSMTARRIKGKDSVPRLWEYKGRIYADNLFRLYDEVGLPLAVSIAECRKRGWIPCLAQFKSDALQAGWSEHRADTTIKEALEDA